MSTMRCADSIPTECIPCARNAFYTAFFHGFRINVQRAVQFHINSVVDDAVCRRLCIFFRAFRFYMFLFRMWLAQFIDASTHTGSCMCM